MTYKLVEIPFNKWSELRDLYTKKGPTNLLPYSLLQNYLSWYKQDCDYVNQTVKVFSLNGDWSDGTFALVVRSLI